MTDPKQMTHEQMTHEQMMRLLNRGALDQIERAAWRGQLRDVQRQAQTDAAWQQHQQQQRAGDEAEP